MDGHFCPWTGPPLQGSFRIGIPEMTETTTNPETFTAPVATLHVHFDLFATDGVSLQAQELTRALTRLGWPVHLCASDLPPETPGLKLPELSYRSAEALALRRRIFAPASYEPARDRRSVESDLLEDIAARAVPIRRRVQEYIREHDIRVLHIRNLMSLPYNLPATLAFYELALARPDLGFVLQHHDLHWEGPNARNFHTPYRRVAELMTRIMCPELPNARNVVINPIAAEELLARTGIQGVVVPDGFDFERERSSIDEHRFRGDLEILVGDGTSVSAEDVVVAMPARVAINKAIELAIQFVGGLQRRRAGLETAPDGVGSRRRRFSKESRVVLLLPQSAGLDENVDYFARLLAYARQSGITLAYAGNAVVADRQYVAGDSEHYPFYSTYQAADIVCYPPEHEGFGNQLIESVWARRPLVLLEYPVFKRYLRDHVPHYISLGDVDHLGKLPDFGGLHLLDEKILDVALDSTLAVLEDHGLEARWAEENARALRELCGMDRVVASYIDLYQSAARPS
jgi:mannosylglucosylglycerate synthase